MPTYDVYYTGLSEMPLQRLTEENFESFFDAVAMIPEIIEHTESEIGEPVDDPENYQVLINYIHPFRR
ncbi:MAG: hypothetical protein F6K30_19305 [Cyanothece sp. SIO2G6]|nr:hypothetical protein [Cyanothece sp. SIO2G6]